MKVQTKGLNILFFITCLVCFGALLLPDGPVRTLLYYPLPNWTWFLNFGLRVLAMVLLLLAFYNCIKHRRKNPLPYLTLMTFLTYMVLQAALSRVSQSPLRFEEMLIYLGVIFFAVYFSLERRERSQDKGQVNGQPHTKDG